VAIQENPEDYEQTGYDEDEEDEVSVENESNDDAHILINNLNTVEQKNTAQINTDLETGDELPMADEGWRTITNHRYNLRPQPKQQNKNTS
jgi:hypothetical protein